MPLCLPVVLLCCALSGLDRVSGHGQLAHPFAGERRQGVGDRGCHQGGSWLADVAGFLGVGDQDDVDGRCLVHAYHGEGVVVGLLHTAFVERDFLHGCSTQAKDDAGLDLRLDGVGVDHVASVRCHRDFEM